MSSADLFEDGFPHSTPDGYRRGCRGNSCPGKLEVGFSCAEAFARSNGDYAYQRRVARGLTPAEIAAEEQAERVTEAVHGDREVAQRVEHDNEAIERALAPKAKPRLIEPKPKAAPKPKAPKVERRHGPEEKPIKHGTPYGYQRGCRDHEDCPGDPATGLSCWQAYRNYQNDYRARRVQNDGAAPLGSNAGMPRGTRRVAVSVDGVTRVTPKLPVAVAHLVQERDARIAELEARLAGTVPDGHGRHRAEVVA